MLRRIIKETRRNSPCPCGSGKRFKACHGRGSSVVPYEPPVPDLERYVDRWLSAERIINSSLPVLELVTIAREGFTFAKRVADEGREAIAYVNSCPYGPGWPNETSPRNQRANAWYYGWWFYWYVVRRWNLVALGLSEE